MKIALLFGGELRNFSEGFGTWEAALESLDYDIMISTWSSTHSFSDRYEKYNHFNKKTEVNKEEIIKIVDERKIKYLNIEEPISFEHRGNNQIYHWQRLLFSLINCKDDYDWVIITRPDAIVNEMFDLAEFIRSAIPSNMYAPETVTVTPPPSPFLVTALDWCFMASPSKMINVFLPLPYMRILDSISVANQLGDNMHSHLAHYFVNNRHFIHGGLNIAVNDFNFYPHKLIDLELKKDVIRLQDDQVGTHHI
jgi:hypothetical protein